jgi:hypothetical protein
MEESRHRVVCSDGPTHLGGQVVTQEHDRTAFVDLEAAAVWRGHEQGVVTDEEVYGRLDELERLLWRRVFGGLRRVAPGSRVYVGFPVGARVPELAAGEAG